MNDIKPANWQITATTIHCDRVDDNVTIMISGDWTYRCAWYQRYKQKAIDGGQSGFDRKTRERIQKCTGPDCPYVIGYRDRLIREKE